MQRDSPRERLFAPPHTSSQVLAAAEHGPDWWLCYEELPNWYLPYASKFIYSGYRPINDDIGECIASLFKWHNELVNVWSHLVPGCVFAVVLFETLLVNGVSSVDDVLFLFLLTSVMYAYLSSAGFHCVMCHSENVAKYAVRCDMIGIIMHLVGMCAYILHSMLHCHHETLRNAFIRIGVYFVVLVFICTRKEFTDKKYKTVKPVPFIIMGILLMQPMVSWARDDAIGPLDDKADVVAWCITSWVLLATAVLFYVARFPERWFPGQFDLLGSSHNWFHFFVVISSTSALVAASRVRQHDWCTLE